MATNLWTERDWTIDTPEGYTSVFLSDMFAPGYMDDPDNYTTNGNEWVTNLSGDLLEGGALTAAMDSPEWGDLRLHKNIFIDPSGAEYIYLQFMGNQYTVTSLDNDGEEAVYLMDGSGSSASVSTTLKFEYIGGGPRPGGVLPIIGGTTATQLLFSAQDMTELYWEETQPTIKITGFSDGFWLMVTTIYDDDSVSSERHDLGYRVLRYDVEPDYGSVETGSSPGGSGDPYIHSLAGSIYKLPDMPGNCRFLSTKQGVEDRFLVDISVEKLRFEEQKALLQELLTYDRDILEKYKLPLDGYYFRNFYISNQNSYIIVNLENGTIKTTDSEKSIKSLYENGGILDYQSFNIEIIKSQLADRKTVANYDLVEMDYTVRIKTHNKIYGNIAVELYSLLNKQIRNSIKITAQYPITLNNSRGAYLMPQHTDNMYVKELGSKKKIKDATNYKENEYKTLTETYYKTNPIEKYTRTLLIQQ